MRTTVDIDDPILKEVKRLRTAEGKSLGRLISDLLAQALQKRKAAGGTTEAIRWVSKGMGARIDLADKEALFAALEQRASDADGADSP